MSLFKDKKVLVTGGTGMIGRELVSLLLEKQAKVKVVSENQLIFQKCRIRKVDLTIYENCFDLVRIRIMFHVGVKGSTKMSVTQLLDYFYQ